MAIAMNDRTMLADAGTFFVKDKNDAIISMIALPTKDLQ